MDGRGDNDLYFVDSANDVVMEAVGRRHRPGPRKRELYAGSGQEIETLSTSNTPGTDGDQPHRQRVRQ